MLPDDVGHQCATMECTTPIRFLCVASFSSKTTCGRHGSLRTIASVPHGTVLIRYGELLLSRVLYNVYSRDVEGTSHDDPQHNEAAGRFADAWKILIKINARTEKDGNSSALVILASSAVN